MKFKVKTIAEMKKSYNQDEDGDFYDGIEGPMWIGHMEALIPEDRIIDVFESEWTVNNYLFTIAPWMGEEV